jgi:hypothetical protein
MQIDYLSIIVVGIATLFVGYFVGLFEGRGQGKKRGQEKPAEVKTQPPAIIPGENNLLKLSLEHNNQLRLEIDGQHADAGRLMPEQRKRLIDLMVMMRPWIDASVPRSSSVPPQPPPAVPVVAPISKPVEKPAAFASASTPRREVKKEEATAPTSMVSQIDAILQVHLASSPLANRGIRLFEPPEGGVVVLVGMNKYNGVNEVPDAEVQAVIRGAIAEWEKKYTPS